MTKNQEFKFVVPAGESGTKLQAFLQSQLDIPISARQIKHAINAGCCLINGRAERFASRLVGTGDRIVFYVQNKDASASSAHSSLSFNSPLRLLYVDQELVFYNKPAGFSSEDPRLLSFVKARLPSAQLMHRLDRDTTGVLMFAGSHIAESVLALFKERRIKKTYLAIVDGIPAKLNGTIDNFLGKISVYQGQTLWGEVPQQKGGLRAYTKWQIKKKGQEASLVVCYPATGRTHQLRVHLSGLGHPILGDHQYGRFFTCSYRPGRILLHAFEIAFEHPVAKRMMCVRAELPPDFLEAEAFLIPGSS